MSRQDQRSVNVVIDGQFTGVWDAKSGGMTDSEETTFRPGAMAERIALGGAQTIENLTCSRLFNLSRDLPRIKSWMHRAGKADVTVVEIFLDADGNAFGNPITYVGKLKSVSPPEHDSESSDAAKVEIEVTVAQVG